MARFVFFLCLFLTGNPGSAQAQSAPFRLMVEGLLSHSIDTVGVERLLAWQQKQQKICLLDAREKEEFEVSHIPGAMFIGHKTYPALALKNLPKDIPLVVYCSIGYRSEQVAERLQKEGFQVYNLYGGIFDWVNKGQALHGPDKQTTQSVHTYNRTWGIWLRRGEKVY